MAASRRSPLMRDQWRAGDDHKDRNRPRNRVTHDRRNISPGAPQVTDVGLKIKGRATVDSVPDSPTDSKRFERVNALAGDRSRGSSGSPSRQRPRDNELLPPPRESSADRFPERPRRQDEGGQIGRRRKTRSRSPQREIFGSREERRRHRSPSHSGRTDTFPTSSRRRERAISQPRLTRGDHYSSTYTDLSGAPSRYGDSYVPGPRLRSRSPPPSFVHPRYTPPHRRPRSRDRPPRLRRTSPGSSRPKRRSPPRRGFKKESESTSSSYRPAPRTRNSPRGHKEPSRPQYQLQSPSRGGSVNPEKGRRSPQSPVEREGARGRTKMQSSTRPMQNTINDGSRPSSPPRPIPSYEAAPHNSGMISEAFPLHGMKASDVHGAHRPSRPAHLNTQQPYSTSPQWTPTSSHHNSPHSGSPFSQGRGGWGGQQQQYHGQSG